MWWALASKGKARALAKGKASGPSWGHLKVRCLGQRLGCAMENPWAKPKASQRERVWAPARAGGSTKASKTADALVRCWASESTVSPRARASGEWAHEYGWGAAWALWWDHAWGYLREMPLGSETA